MRPLIDAHLAHSWDATPQTSNHTFDVDALNVPDIRLWAAFDGLIVLGCGALKSLPDGTAEVKSVHVAAAARKRGVARALMDHMILLARDEKCAALVLETGTMEEYAAARVLYEKLGFSYCAPIYGYEADPNSAFMRLALDPTG